MIERMKFEDLDQVISIENECFNDPWTKKYFEDELNNSEVCSLFVEKENDEIIAYGSIWFMFENCDIVNIAVKKAYQHQGRGQKMLDYLLEQAKNKGCEFAHLEVRKSNTNALNLYKKNGFEITRTRSHYYSDGQDCFDMMKNMVRRFGVSNLIRCNS